MSQNNKLGIYKSIQDFHAKRSSVIVDSTHRKRAIQASNFFLSPNLFYYSDNVRKKIPMDSVYAYIDYKGRIYRIWHRASWLLCDSGEITIYSQVVCHKITVRTSRGNRYNYKQMTDYFFSFNNSSSIFPLITSNLQSVYGYDEHVMQKLLKDFPDSKSLNAKNETGFLIKFFIRDQINKKED